MTRCGLVVFAVLIYPETLRLEAARIVSRVTGMHPGLWLQVLAYGKEAFGLC